MDIPGVFSTIIFYRGIGLSTEPRQLVPDPTQLWVGGGQTLAISSVLDYTGWPKRIRGHLIGYQT